MATKYKWIPVAYRGFVLSSGCLVSSSLSWHFGNHPINVKQEKFQTVKAKQLLSKWTLPSWSYWRTRFSGASCHHFVRSWFFLLTVKGFHPSLKIQHFFFLFTFSWEKYIKNDNWVYRMHAVPSSNVHNTLDMHLVVYRPWVFFDAKFNNCDTLSLFDVYSFCLYCSYIWIVFIFILHFFKNFQVMFHLISSAML